MSSSPGRDPFTGLRVDPAHLRHACEVQARSHLLHLREGFLETRGRGDALAELLLRFGAAARRRCFRASRGSRDGRRRRRGGRARRTEVGVPSGSLARIAQLIGRKNLSSDDARRCFPAYLDAVQRLTAYVDQLESASVTSTTSARVGVRRSTFVVRFVAMCVIAIVVSGFSRTSAQAPLPELTKPVNDFANIIDPADEQQLDDDPHACRRPRATSS